MRSLGIITLTLIMIVIFLLLGPALLLWAVGTLIQGQGLDFTFWNWFAAVVILVLVRGEVSTSSS